LKWETGRAHLLLISRTPGISGGAIGVITLEDVIEEIISEEIVDETDRYEDNQSKKRAKRMTTAAIMRGIVERERNDGAAPEERSPLLPASPHSIGPNQRNGVEIRGISYGSVLSESPA